VTRVVLDSNIYISALRYGGKPHRLLQLALDGEIDALISQPIMEETLRVLRDKLAFTPEELADAAGILQSLELVHPIQGLNAVPGDPDDNKIIECAVAANADVIVSGDKHLLELKNYGNIPIIKVSDFLAR
jgi:uncharacterized protein